MRYKELLGMGFKRNDILANDSLFFNQHGFACFWLEYKLYQKGSGEDPKVYIFIEWEPTENRFYLKTHEKTDVTSNKEISFDEMKVLVSVNKRTGDLPTKDFRYTHAC